MSVKFYKRKPKFLEAIQLVDTAESINQCYAFTKSAILKYDEDIKNLVEEKGIEILDNPPYLYKAVHDSNELAIATKEGERTIVPFGCWIIKNTKGDFYWCTDEVFRDLYDVV